MSTKQILQKKLKAIVFTDMADFTQISAQDGQTALVLIQKQNEIIKPIVEKYNGDWLKEIGDGLLFSFDSSIEAVRCSIQIQETLKDLDDLNIRIGIHQGDIFIKDNDVFGDDVNIASRIEGFAPIGGIAISDKVHKDISDVSDIKSSFIGHRKLKGVEQETKIRCITSNNLPANQSSIMPKIVAYLCFFWSAFSFLGLFVLIANLLFDTDKYHLMEQRELVSKLIDNAMNTVTFLLIGYSCLSYYKGVSIKAQKWLVNLSLLYVIYPIIRIAMNLFLADWIKLQTVLTELNVENELPLIILFAILYLIVLPILIVALFQTYYYMKKHSNLAIFNRDRLALLLLSLFVVLYTVIIFIISYNLHIDH